eukprot:2535336-Pyramimonas_sp.AAC.1
MWQCVRGPLAATIAVLIDLKAIPHSPVYWLFPNGAHVRFTDKAFQHALWHVLMEVCNNLSWSGAAKHYEGSGLSGGVEFT